MQLSKLYPSHVPLSPVSRAVLSVGAAFAAIRDPYRGDMVAAMGESTATSALLEGIRRRMLQDSTGRRLLEEKPRINSLTVDLDYIQKLPKGTLGKAYSDFLCNLNTSPDDRPKVRYIDHLGHLYVMQRYRETHDFTHIVLDMKPNMLGEVAVKYFEGIQLGLPMAISGAIFGGLRLQEQNRSELLNRVLPWVTEQAKNARLFISYDWENNFERPLEDVRKELGVKPFLS